MATEICTRCNGTGKRKFGAAEIKCGACGGTGRKESLPGAPLKELRSRPR